MNWHRHNLKYNFQKRMLCQCHKIPYCDQWAWIEFLIWTDHPVSFLFVFSFTRTRSNLKLKWNRVTCVLKMGWHTHLLESCHWHWHATHWRATQSSNEASFHLPPPLGWPSALSLFQGHWMVMWTRSVWPALTPWILTRTSPASRSAAGKKTSHNFHNSHHLTIETWPEPWMGMRRKRQQLEFFFLSAMCSLCKWGKIKIQVSYNSKIYFDIACIRKCDERSWL